jgi:hypothetical protein
MTGGHLARGAGPVARAPLARWPWREGVLGRLLAHRRRRMTAGAPLCRSTRSWLARHRPELRCVALLGLVGLVTLSLALVSWRATVHRQLEVDRSRTDAASPGRLLVADLEARSPRRSLKDTQTVRSGSLGPTESERSAVPRRSTGANGQGFEVSGPVLAAGSSLPIFAGGLGAARLVLRRHRAAGQTAAAEVEPQNAHVLPPHGDPPGEAGEQEADDRGAEERAAGAHDQAEPEPEVDPEPDRGVAGTVAEPADVAAARGSRQAEPPTAGTWVGHESEAAPTTRLPLLALVAEPRSSETLPGGPEFPASERLYERRELPEIEHICAATVEVGGRQMPVTVLELSERGVSCRTERGQLEPPPSALKAGNYVRVQFPVSSRTLDVKVQVAWRKTSPEGTQLGLHFLRLPAPDAEVIRQACLVATRG